jgi:hypothetical protein
MTLACAPQALEALTVATKEQAVAAARICRAAAPRDQVDLP